MRIPGDLDNLPGAEPKRVGTRPPGLLPALLIAAVAIAWSCVGNDAIMPLARQGVLDLSGWNMAKSGPVRLDGQWELRPGQLLSPEDFARADGAAVYQTLPAPWKLSDESVEAARAGVATLRLRVLPHPGTELPVLRVFNVNSAFRLWANGRLAAQSGVVGASEAEEQAKPASMLVSLPPVSASGEGEPQPLELVLQVSNHHYRDGGVLASLWLGPEESMHAWADRTLCLGVFFASALFIMGLYHVALYHFRRDNVSPLYFACYCFLWMGNYVASDSSEWLARVLLPGLPTRLLDHFALICFFLSVPVGYAFFRSLYPREFPRTVLRFAWGLAAPFSLLALFVSTMTLTAILPLYYFSTAGLIFHCMLRLHRSWRLGREGASFIFAGFLILGLAGLNDMLTDMKLLRSTPLLAPGMLMFILFQAFALSLRLSKAFTAVESLSVQLENKNLSLETEIAERSRLERQIVNISEEERRRMSLDLHDGLCQMLTAARLRCAILSRMKPGQAESRELEHLAAILDEVVDQAYDLSHGLWPLEHGPGGAGPSLHDMIRRFSRSSGVPIEFTQDKGCEACPNQDVTQLHRIAQEALANAVKHAKPTRITVSFGCRLGGQAVLVVRDDGVGRAAADKSKSGLGMGIMAHRARMIGGTLRIEDAEGGGTVVTCEVLCGLTPKQAA